MNISKSKFKTYKTCSKCLWLEVNKPDLAVPLNLDKQIADGKEVGEYAKKYFDNTVDVTTKYPNGDLNINEMIGLTNRYLLEGKNTIAEASFSVDKLFCSIDLLHPDGTSYEIYEVKATTNVEKEHYIDAAFQKYVLEKRGLPISNVYILHLNNEYRRHGEIDVHSLFLRDNITTHPDFLIAYMQIKQDIEDINKMLNEKDEPVVNLSTNCKECPFKAYCHKDIPVPSVLNINALRGTYDYLNRGIVTYQDVIYNQVKLNNRQKVQIDAYLKNRELSVQQAELNMFLQTIRYPAYHLDFESIQLPIPPCDGAWPYEQIPTQYSLHIEYADGRLEHKEFLGDSIDPRRGIAEALCRDIPDDVCVLAYNKAFECTRIKELAETFPDLSEHLYNIREHIVDLLVPFQSGWYYNRAMGGSFSIKSVLPAIFPDDPSLNYHNLEGVHNGGEAMTIFPKIKDMPPEEQKKTIYSLIDSYIEIY